MGSTGLKTNQLYQGDCLQWLAKVKDESVDLVFADPPFNIGYTYDVYDDRKSADDYLQWCSEWISEVKRVLTKQGTFWLAIGDEFAAELKVLAQRDLGFRCRSWVIWYYTFGVNCKRGFSRSHTHLLHFVKDAKEFTFNSENPLTRVPSARQLVYADARANPRGRLPDNTWILRPQDAPEGGFATEHDTWYYPRVAGTFKERAGFHGCQMPEQILGRIIRLCSNPGDLVLDPFAGSGTTLVVAKKLGRRYLGTELSESYAERVKQRLEETTVDTPLEGVADPLTSAPKTSEGKRRTRSAPKRPAKSTTQSLVAAPTDSVPLEIAQAVGGIIANTYPDIAPVNLLVDHQTQKGFHKECRRQDIEGDPHVWNKAVWQWLSDRRNQRQKSHPSALLSIGSLDAFRPAAEAALTLVARETNCPLSDVICHPDRVAEFDQCAAAFAPDASPNELRWTATVILRQLSNESHDDATDTKWSRMQLPPAVSIEQMESPGGLDVGVMVVENPQGETLTVSPTADLAGHLERFQTSPQWRRLEASHLRWIREPHQDQALAHTLAQRLNAWLNVANTPQGIKPLIRKSKQPQ